MILDSVVLKSCSGVVLDTRFRSPNQNPVEFRRMMLVTLFQSGQLLVATQRHSSREIWTVRPCPRTIELFSLEDDVAIQSYEAHASHTLEELRDELNRFLEEYGLEVKFLCNDDFCVIGRPE